MTHADDIDAIGIHGIGPDPDKLLVFHRQQLSAMLDGELSPDEAKFMLRRLQHDGELAACWERWQVCGDVLRGRHHALLPADFASRVAVSIAGGDQVTAIAGEDRHTRAMPARSWRWGGGAALAASIALVAVFTGRQLPDVEAPLVEPWDAPRLATSPAGIAPAGGAAAPLIPVPAAAGESQEPRPPAPVADATAALAATAVAATQVQQRRRGERAASQRASLRQVEATASPPVTTVTGSQVALVAEVPAADGVAHPAFPAPSVLQGRPWPRSLLSGGNGSAFNVGLSSAPAHAFVDPFLPRFERGVDGLLPPAADRMTDPQTRER